MEAWFPIWSAYHGARSRTGFGSISLSIQATKKSLSCRIGFPRIRAVPVSEVTTADGLAVLTPIWHDKPETARRVRQRIGAVMKWAVAMGYRPYNLAGDALG